jgi:hypothetical protein
MAFPFATRISMGVTTTADEHLESARDNVSSAIRHLSEIVIEECWGHDEFVDEYRARIEQAFDQLRAVKKVLQP